MTAAATQQVVQKLWNYCNVLRDDGLSYGDYVEQLTYLLFLKMAHERTQAPWSQPSFIPAEYDWTKLLSKDGDALEVQYRKTLEALGRQPGMLGLVFRKAQNRIQDPAKLRRLVIDLIDRERWMSLKADVKGDAYEGLLQKNAEDTKSGAGQYFTPRPLIQAIVTAMQPEPEMTICDPACGTGGFLVAAYEWLLTQTKGGAIDRAIAKRLKTKTYYGQDLVARPRRLALMNLYLHGIEPTIKLGDTIYEPPSSKRFDVVLTNPPFGTRGANQAPERDDFTIETSNKQLNFLQHVMTILKSGGLAAVVLPDNCLFEDKAGEVFEILIQDCNLHTILRLPRGTFTPYTQGVKANVVFFQKGRPTENVWIFDARANVSGITKKDRPLTRQHFIEFEKCYGTDPNGLSKRKDLGEEGRFRCFSAAEVKRRDFKLDITWLKDESLEDGDDLPEPQELATDAIAELEAVIKNLREIVDLVEKEEGVA